MKKYFKLFVLVICVVLISGCGKEKEVVKTCKLVSNDVTQGYKLESKYVIYGTGETVDKVETIEIVTSDDEEVLSYFEETLKSTYELMEETYDGYDVTITNENGKVESKVTIDYSEMDLDKYIEDNTVMKNYVTKDNELLISGIEELYVSMGAVCE